VKPQAKVSRVMREFKKGDLKSSSGQKVTNPKQAIAIGLSEAGISKKAKGGEMKESKAMMKKEVSFMKKKGAPKSMLKHEMAEMKGMKHGGKTKKMAMGGMGQLPPPPQPRVGPSNPGPMPRPVSRPPTPRLANPVSRPPTAPRKAPTAAMLNKPSKMAGGGLAAGHKSADGVASKGKTKAKQVVMKGAGKGMKKGGYC
jgi:hypothetical protein